ncbi:hypothetical protein ACPWR0_18435 [Pandoraea pneumonica]
MSPYPRPAPPSAVTRFHLPADCAALRERFAAALTHVLQLHVDIVSPPHPKIRLAHLQREANFWEIHLATCDKPGEPLPQDATPETHPALQLTLRHLDFTGHQITQYAGTVPFMRAFMSAGAMIRQYQRLQWVPGMLAPRAIGAETPWRIESLGLPMVNGGEVDAFALDMSRYLRSASCPCASMPAPSHLPHGPVGSVTSEISLDNPPPSPFVSVTPSLSCPEGIPAFHGTSPTVMRSRDLARYAFARSRFGPARDIWHDLAAWGFRRAAISTFVCGDLSPRVHCQEALEHVWNGRFVCLDDLIAWDETGAQFDVTQRRVSSASLFAQTRHVDSSQFEDMIGRIPVGDLVAFHRQGRPLEDFNRGHIGLRVFRFERAPSTPPLYFVKSCRQRIAGEADQ